MYQENIINYSCPCSNYLSGPSISLASSAPAMSLRSCGIGKTLSLFFSPKLPTLLTYTISLSPKKWTAFSQSLCLLASLQFVEDGQHKSTNAT